MPRLQLKLSLGADATDAISGELRKLKIVRPGFSLADNKDKVVGTIVWRSDNWRSGKPNL